MPKFSQQALEEFVDEVDSVSESCDVPEEVRYDQAVHPDSPFVMFFANRGATDQFLRECAKLVKKAPENRITDNLIRASITKYEGVSGKVVSWNLEDVPKLTSGAQTVHYLHSVGPVKRLRERNAKEPL